MSNDIQRWIHRAQIGIAAEKCEQQYALRLRPRNAHALEYDFSKHRFNYHRALGITREVMMKDDTKAALVAMTAEEIFTTIQVANSDELFMNAMTDAQKDSVIKASIEKASKVQEDTGNWPTFEEWLKFRSELIHEELNK